MWYSGRVFSNKNIRAQYFLTGFVFLYLIGFVCSFRTWANSLSAEEVMNRVFNRNDGEDAYFKIRMILIDRHKNERKRILEVYTKDYKGLTKRYLVFQEPADIKGVKFLSWENKGKEDTQYLYLPALGRARRIVSSQKGLQFVNTDYTYEDMQRRPPQKDNHRFLGEDKFGSWRCFVVESVPKQEQSSQYSKRVSWVEKNSFVVVRRDFYNKKGEKSKEFIVKELRKVSGIWTPMKTVMTNLKRAHKTLMEIVDVKYNQGVSDELFTLYNLEKE